MALDTSAAGSSSGTKRVRLAELQGNAESTQSSQPRASQRAVNEYYDPDQDVAERRKIRKGLRDLQREMNGRFGAGFIINMTVLMTNRLQR